MLRRTLLALLILPLALPGQDNNVRRRQRPTPPTPTAPVQYRYESTTLTNIEMPDAGMDILSMMPGLKNQNIHILAYFTITTVDSARGKVYHLVLDSLQDNMAERMAGLNQMMGTLGGGGAMGGSQDSMLQVAQDRIREMMMTPPPGSTVHRFVRDGRTLVTRTTPERNARMLALASALDELVPSAKMLQARWNDSWTENAGVSVPSGSEGLPIKTGGATRWRVSGKDTIDAVIATTMSMLTDSNSVKDMVSTAATDSTAAAALANTPLSLRGSVNGTKRVILDEDKSVKEVSSSVETVTNMAMPLAELGSIKARVTAKVKLIKLP